MMFIPSSFVLVVDTKAAPKINAVVPIITDLVLHSPGLFEEPPPDFLFFFFEESMSVSSSSLFKTEKLVVRVVVVVVARLLLCRLQERRAFFKHRHDATMIISQTNQLFFPRLYEFGKRTCVNVLFLAHSVPIAKRKRTTLLRSIDQKTVLLLQWR
jgi:hypothetical protein